MSIRDLFKKKEKKPACFEDRMSEALVSLAKLCGEYADGNADMAFAYGRMERGWRSFDAFFEKDGKIIRKEKICTDRARSTAFLREGAKDLEKLYRACMEFSKPVPTELKVICDIKRGKMDSKLSYEPVPETEMGEMINFNKWLEEETARRLP